MRVYLKSGSSALQAYVKSQYLPERCLCCVFLSLDLGMFRLDVSHRTDILLISALRLKTV